MSESKLITCPSCITPNRVPSSKLVDAPVCGRCKQRLFVGAPAELTTEQFEKLIRNTDIPIVVDFWASWCGPCQMMAPVFAQVASQLEPSFRFVKTNTESEHQLSARYGIRSIPSLLVFQRGKEVARQAGALDAGRLTRWLKSLSL